MKMDEQGYPMESLRYLLLPPCHQWCPRCLNVIVVISADTWQVLKIPNPTPNLGGTSKFFLNLFRVYIRCKCFLLSVYLSIYLFVCMSVCLSICLSVYLSICLSVYLSICLSACLSVYLSVCLSIYPSIYLSFYLSISVCLPACLAVGLSFCCIFVFLYPFIHT